jgi:hypothetical protein
MTKRLFTAGLLSLGLMLATSGSFAASDLDFTIANKTGYGIKELHVAPSASTNWEENLLDEVLEHNEEIEITFDPKAHKATKWDIMITFVDDNERVYWKGCKLEEISRITLKYNRKTGETSALTE